MCNDDIRNYNSKISDLGYLTLASAFAYWVVGIINSFNSALTSALNNGTL